MPARFLSAFLVFSLLLSQSGCTAKPPQLALREELLTQRIALVADSSQTDTSLELFASSRAQGALKGAGEGIAGMLQGLGGSNCSGEVCGAALLLYLAFAVVFGGTVGAIQGSLKATPEKKSGDNEAFIAALMRHFSSQLTLANRVLIKSREIPDLSINPVSLPGCEAGEACEEFKRLAAYGYQKALAVALTRCDFVLAGQQQDDPALALNLEARVRITDIGSGVEVYSRKYEVGSQVRRYSDWLKMDPASLSREVDSALDSLSTQIVDTLFLTAALPMDSGTWRLPGTEDYGCCWICPVSPPLNIDYFPQVKQQWSHVPSRQPTLEWQPFPGSRRQVQLEKNTGYPATDVRYDLKIWRMDGVRRGALVYERAALPAAIHRVEEPLMADSRYLWSIRACFTLGARKACTPWAFSLVPSGPKGCESTWIKPESNYYRFVTP